VLSVLLGDGGLAPNVITARRSDGSSLTVRRLTNAPHEACSARQIRVTHASAAGLPRCRSTLPCRQPELCFWCDESDVRVYGHEQGCAPVLAGAALPTPGIRRLACTREALNIGHLTDVSHCKLHQYLCCNYEIKC
jgi:hypothetical protein